MQMTAIHSEPMSVANLHSYNGDSDAMTYSENHSKHVTLFIFEITLSKLSNFHNYWYSYP